MNYEEIFGEVFEARLKSHDPKTATYRLRRKKDGQQFVAIVQKAVEGLVRQKVLDMYPTSGMREFKPTLLVTFEEGPGSMLLPKWEPVSK